MSKHKALKGAIAAVASVATLGALAAPALAADTTYSPNGKSVAELAQHGGAQLSATKKPRMWCCSSATAWAIRKSLSPVTI